MEIQWKAERVWKSLKESERWSMVKSYGRPPARQSFGPDRRYRSHGAKSSSGRFFGRFVRARAVLPQFRANQLQSAFVRIQSLQHEAGIVPWWHRTLSSAVVHSWAAPSQRSPFLVKHTSPIHTTLLLIFNWGSRRRAGFAFLSTLSRPVFFKANESQMVFTRELQKLKVFGDIWVEDWFSWFSWWCNMMYLLLLCSKWHKHGSVHISTVLSLRPEIPSKSFQHELRILDSSTLALNVELPRFEWRSGRISIIIRIITVFNWLKYTNYPNWMRRPMLSKWSWAASCKVSTT
jgi:hypothetical protein